MARYLLLALNGPTDGDGDEASYHKWYDEEHLPAFEKLPEVVSAKRYKTLRGKVPTMDEPWPYVTAYEIETDDLEGFSMKLAEQMQSFPASLDRSQSANLMTVQISGDG